MTIKEQCKGLMAPDSFWETDEIELSLQTGGCGPGEFGDRLVPDTAYGLSLKPACICHDYFYSIGRTMADKERADTEFLFNMITLVNRGSKWLRYLRRLRAMTYYSMVADFGGSSYQKAIAKFEGSNP